MIIGRAPFRISFFGGGTDYPVWYREHPGAVLATSINKYCYVTARYLPPFFDYKYRIRYTQREEVQNIWDIKHPSARECLAYLKFFDRGVEIQHNGDLPARIGLGSSSAFTVCLLNAQHALKGEMVTKMQLSLEAIHIEQDRIREHVGSQDQTIAAFGGFNKIEFGGEQQIQVLPVTISAEKLQHFHEHLMLFHTGFVRTASEIAIEQIKNTPVKHSELNRMREMVEEGLDILNCRHSEFVEFGKLMHEGWMLKRSLTNRITTPFVDEIYEAARKAGAWGGKPHCY